MIQKRHLGFHPPVSLPGDAVKYVAAMRRLQGLGVPATRPPTSYPVVPGNDEDALASVHEHASKLLPVAEKILQLEAQLSALYNQYDKDAVALWNELTGARDHAELYAEKHDDAAVHALTAEVVYHAGRVRRADPTGTPPKS